MPSPPPLLFVSLSLCRACRCGRQRPTQTSPATGGAGAGVDGVRHRDVLPAAVADPLAATYVQLEGCGCGAGGDGRHAVGCGVAAVADECGPPSAYRTQRPFAA